MTAMSDGKITTFNSSNDELIQSKLGECLIHWANIKLMLVTLAAEDSIAISHNKIGSKLGLFITKVSTHSQMTK